MGSTFPLKAMGDSVENVVFTGKTLPDSNINECIIMSS